MSISKGQMSISTCELAIMVDIALSIETKYRSCTDMAVRNFA